jgi:hypothetical protein
MRPFKPCQSHTLPATVPTTLPTTRLITLTPPRCTSSRKLALAATALNEHELVRQAQRLSGDPAQHAHVAEVAAVMDRAVASALSITDPDLARELLPTALRDLYHTVQPLIGAGLINGTVWLTQQHARLFAHAQVLFGSGAERVIQRPPHEPLPTPRGAGVFTLPRP